MAATQTARVPLSAPRFPLRGLIPALVLGIATGAVATGILVQSESNVRPPAVDRYTLDKVLDVEFVGGASSVSVAEIPATEVGAGESRGLDYSRIKLEQVKGEPLGSPETPVPPNLIE